MIYDLSSKFQLSHHHCSHRIAIWVLSNQFIFTMVAASCDHVINIDHNTFPEGLRQAKSMGNLVEKVANCKQVIFHLMTAANRFVKLVVSFNLPNDKCSGPNCGLKLKTICRLIFKFHIYELMGCNG